MYRKFIRPNLIWPDIRLIWPENIWLLAIIISPDMGSISHQLLVTLVAGTHTHILDNSSLRNKVCTSGRLKILQAWKFSQYKNSHLIHNKLTGFLQLHFCRSPIPMFSWFCVTMKTYNSFLSMRGHRFTGKQLHS